MRTVLLLSLALVLAFPVAAWAGGATSGTAAAPVAYGPEAPPADAGSGSDAAGSDAADADQVRARDQLRDGSCELDAEITPTDPTVTAPQTQTQVRTRTTAQMQTQTQGQIQTRTQAQDGSCDATAEGDGIPDRDQLRDRDQLKDGSCDATSVLLAAAVYADESTQDLDRTQERDTLVERIMASVPDGVAAWFQTMLRVFGLVK